MNKLHISVCPTCGQKGMKRAVVEVASKRRGKVRRVGGVEVDLCPHCGEQLYDMDAMDQIQAPWER